jgi:DUF1365 family protein
MTESCLYRGQVTHQRLEPVGHRFTYQVVSLLVDLDELPDLRLRFLAHNRPNLFSVNDSDLGEGGSPRRWIETALAQQGINIANGRVKIHLFPRVLGFGFSPLVTWFCHDANGRLVAVLYEVHNTFGERHAYLSRVDDDGHHWLRHTAEKCFHVSPFIGLAGTYAFGMRVPDEKFALSIRETDRATGRTVMIARHVGHRLSLCDSALVRAALAYPLLPLKIVGGIHWEALKLWLKGAPFHRKPVPPAAMVSIAEKGGFP